MNARSNGAGGAARRVASRRLASGRWEAVRSPLLAAGAAIVLLYLVVAVLAPVLAPFDPKATASESWLGPSGAHLLGTDNAGRDIFSQLIWGARYSLTVAVTATALAALGGVVVGMVAGLVGGVVDLLAMRLVDLFLALPGLPLAVLITALAGPSIGVLILVVALAGWAPIARVVRSQTLSLRQRGFIRAAQGYGGGPLYVVRRHLVPAVAPVLAAQCVDFAATAIFVESGLAFLGLGDPLRVSWGTLLDRAFRQQGLFFSDRWLWWVLPAGIAITVVITGFTLVGVGLEPVFNRRVERAR